MLAFFIFKVEPSKERLQPIASGLHINSFYYKAACMDAKLRLIGLLNQILEFTNLSAIIAFLNL